MGYTNVIVNGEVHDTFPSREEAVDAHTELLKTGEVSPANGDTIRTVREWYTTEEYDDDHVYWSTSEYDVDLFLEPPSERYPTYSVGLFDRTMFSVSVPNATEKCQTLAQALSHAFSLVEHLDEYIKAFRETEDYQRAMQVEAECPPFSPGNIDNKLPGYLVSNAKSAVYRGDETVEEAVAELEAEAEERGIDT